MAIQSINPATGEVLASFEEMPAGQIGEIIAAAQAATTAWAAASFEERAGVLREVAAVLRARQADLAQLPTLEMGKPIVESEAEVEKSAWGCEYYAEHAARFLAPEAIASSAQQSYVEYMPLGIVLGIMPWNFPYWQAFRFIAPTLMAGNTVLLKHASNVSQCALQIEAVLLGAGLPAGVFRSLLIPGAAVAAIVEDPRIRAVSLTGSSETGSAVGAVSGRALKKTLFELGGSDPFVVLADADVPAAATTAARARFLNTGQSCIAAKRFIVVEEVADEFERRLIAEVAMLRVGDPLDRVTQVGPLARRDLRDALAHQVRRSVAQGARVALGGTPLPGPGYFYAPTVLTGVTRDMVAAQEETFGPAAAVMRAADTEAALALANDTPYGLGASLWTRDEALGRRLARRVQAGAVFINGMVASDPRLPFGGVKNSGYGRELSSAGIREFVNQQTVWVGPAV